MKGMSNRVARILLAFVLLQPTLALAHEILVVAVAALVGAFSSTDLLYQLVKQFLASPVHAKIMVETLGGVRAEGIVVAGLPGLMLNQFLPALFIAPGTIITSAWISAIVDKDSTVLGFLATQAIVEFLVIVLGVRLLQIGLCKRSIWNVLKIAPARDALSVVIGLFMIAQAIRATFGLTLSPALAGLRETGIGVGFSLLLQLDKSRYSWLMDEALPVLIPTTLIGAAIGTAWLTGKLLVRIQMLLGKQAPAAKRPISARVVRKAHLAVALAPLLVVASVSPRYFGIADTSLVAQVAQSPAEQPNEFVALVPPTPTRALPTPAATPTAIPIVITTPNVPTAILSPTNTPTAFPSATPTPVRQRQVELQRAGKKFSLAVNGRPTYVTGLNYNVNYTALPDDVKRKFHKRDFQIMRNAGVNAVIGWGVYDQVTLEIANEFGIGVVMPFELDPKGAYGNKGYREQIKNEFRKFVNTYKNAPAVWGWNPGGDELLHRMETEHRRTPDKLQFAADFLLELSTLAYTLDPNHVSIVKEPRDWYVPYVEESIRRARVQRPAADPSQYFIFASNTYGKPDGVALVLHTTKQSIEERVGVALAVGEYAPFGLARNDRPGHYGMMWNTVRAVSSVGGFAYVFGPDQPNPRAPNPYDPLRLLVSEFSLVDSEGNPVDGSLNALASQWRLLSPDSPAKPRLNDLE